MATTFFADINLAMNPPVKRAAYSDRTAWLMAEFSKLVYEPFPSNKGEASIIDTALGKIGFQVLEYWDADGTQAMLIRRDARDGVEGMLVLVFRGTQLKEARDVMVDINLRLTGFPGGGRVHAGFLNGFTRVEQSVKAALEKYNDAGRLPLYITGHSLGGALALIATRAFDADNCGATYTFGCPRTADEAFFEPIKTPVYRIVNAGDGVARMPLGYSLAIAMSILRLIPFNGTFWLSKWVLGHVSGYAHYGSLIFISGADDSVKVRMSPDIFWQAPFVVLRWAATLGKALLSDHGMDEYRQKLMTYAKKRSG